MSWLSTRAGTTRLAVAVLIALLGSGGQAALADTTTETGVSVTLVDEGTFSVTWGSEDVAFLVDGEAPALTAASPSVTATATFSLVIADTRADDGRPGYTVTLGAGAFTGEGSSTPIGANALTVVNVTGLPEGFSAATAIGSSLDGAVTILTVPDDAAAVNATIAITVAMTIGPGLMPGEYAGSLHYDVVPLVGP